MSAYVLRFDLSDERLSVEDFQTEISSRNKIFINEVILNIKSTSFILNIRK